MGCAVWAGFSLPRRPARPVGIVRFVCFSVLLCVCVLQTIYAISVCVSFERVHNSVIAMARDKDVLADHTCLYGVCLHFAPADL